MYNVKYYDNDLFYTCSLVEFLSRVTKNTKPNIMRYIGVEGLDWLYRNACVNHCLSLEQVSEEMVEEYNIENGNYELEVDSDIRKPTSWDMGKVYMRLILNSLDYEYKAKDADTNEDIPSLLSKVVEIYNSWIVDSIDDYNTLYFTENPQYHYVCYQEGKII